MKFNIRLLYLYLFSFVGLIIVVIGTVRLVDLGIKVIVFKDADTYEYRYVEPRPIVLEGSEEVEEVSLDEKRDFAESEARRSRQRDVSGSLSMIVVGLPLYWYHWRLIRKEGKGKKKSNE